jgi:hypothetical protein
MQPEPATWGAGDPVTTPVAALVVDLGDGPEALEVISWEYARDLTGGSLPGQVRGATGFALGSGSASVHVADGRTPWTGGGTLPGRSCTLEAGHGGDRLPQATAQVRSVNASSALSTERVLPLEDDLRGMRSPMTGDLSVQYGYAVGEVALLGVDAVSLLAAAGRAGGFRATPPPLAAAGFLTGTLASIPAQGTPEAEVGRVSGASSTTRWVRMAPVADWGGARLVGFVGGAINASVTDPDPTLRSPWSHVVLVAVVPRDPDAGAGPAFINTTIAPDEATGLPAFSVGIRRFRDGFTSLTWGADTQLNTSATSDLIVADFDMKASTGPRARFWRGAAAGWSAWWTPPSAPAVPAVARVIQVTANIGATATPVAGVQVIRGVAATADAVLADLLAFTPSADLEPARVSLQVPDIPADASAWQVVQEVAASTLGAAWIDERGRLVYRSRDSLRGAGAPVETLGVDGLADLPWSISVDDVADRVSVSYSPPVVVTSPQDAPPRVTVGRAAAAVRVPAFNTVVVDVDLDGAAAEIDENWLPLWGGGSTADWSRWAAATSADGGGTQPADGALSIRSVLLNPRRARLTITNNTFDTLWTVDGTGAPSLIIRGRLLATPGEPVTISSGLAEDVAVNALDVDLGSYVQDDATAQEMLAWITGMVTAPLPVLEDVEVVPDLRRQLGDVVTVVDPDHTGVRSKALVVGVRNAGRVGSLTQQLRLAVLDPTFNDLDRYLAAQGVVTFDDLDAHLDAVGVVDFDDLDAYLSTALVEEI